MRRLALLGVLLAGACQGEPPRPAPSPTPATPPPAAPPDAASPCPGLAARWEAALAAASTTCATDADCGCFNGGVSERAGCGGVANTASVAALEAQRDAFVSRCPMTIQCGPWACEPRCAAGRCAN